jgi:guanylate kinase
MSKKIILCGKAASGKDYFRDYLESKGYKTSISHTSRPKRAGEVNGVAYHFINKLMFKILILFRYFFEYKEFNGWYYGTSNKEMEKSDVFILTPGGINDLPFSFRKECVIVYFNICRDVRMDRLMQRSDSDSIIRRMRADSIDFTHFSDYDLDVNDSFFIPELVLEQLNSLR